MALARVAQCCRPLARGSSKGLFCGVLRPVWVDGCSGAKRHLLSEDIIKLQDLQERKLVVAHYISGINGNYFEIFSEKLQSNELILRDHLKRLLHLCQNAEHMMIATEAIKRYHAQNRHFAAQEFRFGPPYMRLCYEMGLEDLAFATITDESMSGFFCDSTSFNIAADMLFNKGSYEDALKVIETMRDQGIHFNKDTFTLVSATCYKLNTAESYRFCTSIIEEAERLYLPVSRRGYYFALALALRQNDVKGAKSLSSEILNQSTKICRNLNVVLLTMSGAVEDAVSVLSAAKCPQSPFFVKKTEFSQEVVDLLRLRSKDGPYMAAVEQVVAELEEADQVTQETLDSMLCYTPAGSKRIRSLTAQAKYSKRTQKPQTFSLLTE